MIPVLIPIIYGAFLIFRPIETRRSRNLVTMAVVLVNTLLSLLVIWNCQGKILDVLTLYSNVHILMRIDGMGALFGAMVTLLWPFATLYAFEYMHHETRENGFFAYFTMTYGVTLGIAYAGNMMTMYLFYELLTLVTIPLVMHTHSPKARQAGRLYAYYSIGGAAFAFTSLIFITVYGRGQMFTYGGFLSESSAAHPIALKVIFVMAFLGFGVKAAVFPMHGWLIRASVAPTPVTALLHAVAVVKAGVFAILRLTYYCYDIEELRGTWAQWIPLILTLITVVYGSTMAIKETHFKRRLAFSTISNLSYILMAACLMTKLGFYAALAHMLAHAVSKICAFFVSGAILVKTEYVFVPAMTGIGRKMKTTFMTFIVASLSLCGVPLTIGFISKWQIAKAAFEFHSLQGILVITALFLAALMSCIYMFSIVIRGMMLPIGRSSLFEESLTDPGWQMTLPLCVFAITIIGLGIYSAPLMSHLWLIAQGLL